MSWLKSAVNRAVEVGGNSNITRTVRNYADTVVFHAGNAVSGGARIIQDRFGQKNVQSFRLAVKRLEEVSVSCRGIERVQLLRRWLVVLKEIERLSSSRFDNNENNGIKDRKAQDHQVTFDEAKDSPRKLILVYYIDPDMGAEPMNFRNVFLYSQALEGMTLSMILDAPNEEEVGLLLELFGLCLTGGKEVHETVMSNIQDLARAFSKYQGEVLAKREELLQHAQGAIAGLKINADLTRIDTEARTLMEKLDKLKAVLATSSKDNVDSDIASTENLQDVLEHIRNFLKLEGLLLKKKSLSNGDSHQLHNEKVDKLKVLLESLINTTSNVEKRILEHRLQKEEAFNYRVSRTNEVSQLEEDLAADIRKLEMRKDNLEAELKKVDASLVSARARLRNAREEREQFDEASNQLLIHLKSKEEELLRSASSCRSEADVVGRWIVFLENTWDLHTKYTEEKEKQVNGELEKYGNLFVDTVIYLLSAYKGQLKACVPKVKNLVENLCSSKKLEVEKCTENGNTKTAKSIKDLEKEYLDVEGKLLTIFDVVETMKKQFYAQDKGISRKDDQRVKDLFDALGRTKEEFESIERPVIEVESSTKLSQSPSSAKTRQTQADITRASGSQAHKQLEKMSPDAGEETGGLESMLDDGDDSIAEEISDWEFDALEKDAKA